MSDAIQHNEHRVIVWAGGAKGWPVACVCGFKIYARTRQEAYIAKNHHQKAAQSVGEERFETMTDAAVRRYAAALLDAELRRVALTELWTELTPVQQTELLETAQAMVAPVPQSLRA